MGSMQVAAEETTSYYLVDRTTVIACPSSLVLETIEHHFKRCGNILDLMVPVVDIRVSDTRSLEGTVTVEYEAHPNRSFMARYDDRVVFRWYPTAAKVPRFTGRFTIRPLGSGTELALKGQYQLPVGLPRRCAACRIELLLGILKAVLETEFDAFVRFQHGSVN